MGDFWKGAFWISAAFIAYIAGMLGGYTIGFNNGTRAGIDATIAEVARQVQNH